VAPPTGRDVLEYLSAVELCGPSRLAKPGHALDDGSVVFDLRASSILPWSSTHPVKVEGSEYSNPVFDLYLGVFEFEVVRQFLEFRIGSLPVDFGERLDGESALAVVRLNGSGEPLKGSFAFSSLAFALPKLQEFYPRVSAIAERFAAWSTDHRETVFSGAGQVTFDLIERAVQTIKDALEWPDLPLKASSYVRVWWQGETAPREPQLNSPRVRVLDSLLRQLEAGSLPAAVLSLLGSDEQEQERIDLTTSWEPVLEQLDLDNLSSGAWPSLIPSCPSTSEQFAVTYLGRESSRTCPVVRSLTVARRRDRLRIIRELVAGLMVERATVLSAVERPELLGRSSRGQELSKMLAARHLVIVTSDVTRARKLEAMLQPPGLEGSARCVLAIDEKSSRLSAALTEQQAAMLRDADPVWSDAVKKFALARQRLRQVTTAQREAQLLLRERARLRREVEVLRGSAEMEQSIVAGLEARHREVFDKSQQSETLAADCGTGVEELERKQPTLTSILFSLGSEYREWSKKAREARTTLAMAQANAQQDRDSLSVQGITLEARRRELAGTLQQIDKERSAWLATFENLEDFLSAQSFSVPDEGGARLSYEARNSLTPWITEEFQSAREDLFVAAVGVHDALIAALGSSLLEKAAPTIDILERVGSYTRGVEQPEASLASFAMLLPVLVVPVERLNSLVGQIEPGSFPRIVIDDGGAFRPSEAIGAMSLGAELQVLGTRFTVRAPSTNPIESFANRLRQDLGLPKWIAPGESSVQLLADRISRIGTICRDNWLSPVLASVRGVDGRIVSLLNRVQYNDMLLTAGDVCDPTGRELPRNAWYDVPTVRNDGHFVADEGDVVDALLYSLSEFRFAAVVTSPFDEVVQSLRRRFKESDARHLIVRASTLTDTDARIVILVLGGSPGSAAAIDWASSEKGPLTSVLACASERLYVVGDRTRWGLRAPFSQLAEALPVAGIDERLSSVRFGAHGTMPLKVIPSSEAA